MSIALLVIENKTDKLTDELCAKYEKRIKAFSKFTLVKLPAARVKESAMQQQIETTTIAAALKPDDIVVLCDENGLDMNSVAFSQFMDKQFAQLRGRLVFVIGGAYGFTNEIKSKHTCIKLSNFVLPHHLARVVLMEQIYRAFCISRNMPYHHS